MKPWLRRIRGALGMGLTWGIAWGLVGMAIELVHNIWPNPLGSLVDIWPAALAYPGFLGGVAFSAVLGIAGRRRRFNELSLPRFAAWGAVGGVLLSSIPTTLAGLGLATPASAADLWLFTAVVAGPLVALCSASATASLALARLADDRAPLEAGGNLPGVGSGNT